MRREPKMLKNERERNNQNKSKVKTLIERVIISDLHWLNVNSDPNKISMQTQIPLVKIE
jgi:hypothetical protein